MRIARAAYAAMNAEIGPRLRAPAADVRTFFAKGLGRESRAPLAKARP